jgi:micrococcal nuclease
MARVRAVLVAGAAFCMAAAVGWWSGGEPADYVATIVEVIDGDTVVARFADGHTATVRILGVDTPETKHPTVGVECFGPEASAYTTSRLTGRGVRVELDREVHDKYGRLLAHIWLDGHRISDELLRRGLAEWLVLPPNGRYAREQLLLELNARAGGVGMWSACACRCRATASL